MRFGTNIVDLKSKSDKINTKNQCKISSDDKKLVLNVLSKFFWVWVLIKKKFFNKDV